MKLFFKGGNISKGMCKIIFDKFIIVIVVCIIDYVFMVNSWRRVKIRALCSKSNR